MEKNYGRASALASSEFRSARIFQMLGRKIQIFVPERCHAAAQRTARGRAREKIVKKFFDTAVEPATFA